VQREIRELERSIHLQHRSNETSRRLETIPGIGVIGATAIAATVTIRPLLSPDVNLLLGSGWCHGKIRPAAKNDWGRSPRRAIDIRGDYSLLVPRPSYAMRERTATHIHGLRNCWRDEQPRRWQQRSPIKLPASLGPLWHTVEAIGHWLFEAFGGLEAENILRG
jgi:hypothetical protein